tara:strand:+ start:1776 stop:2054 length:279 start_codon:yes stop_codon:yes gene_type:complete
MIALPHIVEYQKLKDWYLKLSSFIRTLDNHINFDKSSDFGQVLDEIKVLETRLSNIITEMDAFEQSDLVVTTSLEKTRQSNEQYIKVRNRGE